MDRYLVVYSSGDVGLMFVKYLQNAQNILIASRKHAENYLHGFSQVLLWPVEWIIIEFDLFKCSSAC